MKRLLLLLPVVALAGCGNYVNVEAQGVSGMSSAGGGQVTVHLYVCEGSAVDRLDLVGGFYDGPAGSNNPPLGALEPPEPVSGYVAVDLADPEPWEVVDGGSSIPFTVEKYLSNVALTVGDLEALEPGLVVRDSVEQPHHVYGTAAEFADHGKQWCAERMR